MIVVHGYSDVPRQAQGAVIALGNFDGVHRGHQALLDTAKKIAREAKRPAGALLFEPQPREFFAPNEPHFRLTSLDEKLRIFRNLGLDLAIVLKFDAALAQLDAENFVKAVLVDALAVSHVVAGYHFFFGRARSGTPETLRTLGRSLGFDVTVVEPVGESGEIFSSTAIRLHLAQGDVTGAARALGRWWRVKGTVVTGAKRGTELGYPTANIALPKGTALAHGIYAVRVSALGRRFEGVAYLGTRPMFDNGSPVLEVFLFDFSGNLYGQEIEVEFVSLIRGDRKFDSIADLKAHMAADCAAARNALAAARGTTWSMADPMAKDNP